MNRSSCSREISIASPELHPSDPYEIVDLHLQSPSSPWIDAADNNVVATCALDLDGKERFKDDPATFPDKGLASPEHPDDIVDMGAYEFSSVLQSDCNGNALEDACELVELISPDCNDNGIPDDCDIAAGADDEDGDGIMDECECGTCPTDANGDGDTGAADLAELLAMWGPLVFGECLDANDDLDIGPLDLASLLAAWGPCQ